MGIHTVEYSHCIPLAITVHKRATNLLNSFFFICHPLYNQQEHTNVVAVVLRHVSWVIGGLTLIS